MKIHKRWWTAALLCCLLTLLLAVSAGAVEEYPIDFPIENDGVLQGGGYDIFQRLPWESSFAVSNSRPDGSQDPPGYQELLEGFRQRKETIDLTGLGISEADFRVLLNLVINENGDLFYVLAAANGLWGDASGNITTFKPAYNLLNDDEGKNIERFRAAADEALISALGSTNPAGMTDLQKALALHDWIVTNTRYNYETANDINIGNITNSEKFCKVHSAYGTLVEKDSVCQGIALAYAYLLRRVGISAGYVVSGPMNHAWNWVKIGDKFYHVDATHDDPTFSKSGKKLDLPGYCSHPHFLRCNDHLENHHDFDPVLPASNTDHKYESGYLFNNAKAGFFWYVNKFYYLSNDAITTAPADLKGTYQDPPEYYHNRVTIRGGDKLFYYYDALYSQSGHNPKIGAYDLSTNTATELGTGNMGYDPSLHGLKVSGNDLQCVKLVNGPEPQVIQTFPNVVTSTANTVTVTFDSKGGSAVSSVSLLMGGRIAKPSDPTKTGYIFKGWYKEDACSNQWNFATDTVPGDMTLYAKWEEDPVALSGTTDCGAGLRWVLYESGLLNISGTGAMNNFTAGTAPWFRSRAANDIEKLVIEDGVTSIGSYAFDGCTRLKSTTIPNSVKTIGEHAFSDCTGLTSLSLPSVTSIGGSAFSGCSGLTSMSLPSSLTTIGDSAFSGCTGLTTLTIPASVTTIGDDAFSGCSSSLTLKVTPGSAAETYAKSHGIKYNNGSSGGGSGGGGGLPRTGAEDGTAVHGVVFVLLAAMSLCAWTIGRKRRNR